MDISFVWKVVVIVFMATLLLRIAGRKTISEMTLSETVLMISIGTLFIQPVTSDSLWQSMLASLSLILSLLALEYLQLKSDRLERLLTGSSKVIIENGQIKEQELFRLHLTVDQLEMYLRQNNIASIQAIEIATLEPSGRLGFILKEAYRPATKADVEEIQDSIEEVMALLTQVLGENWEKANHQRKEDGSEIGENNIFTEVKEQGHKKPPANDLQ